MTTKNVLFEHNEAQQIGTISINRPDKYNALNKEVLEELKELLLELSQMKRNSLKGLILTGVGDKAFIAGADIAQMGQMTPQEAKEFARLGQSVTLLLEQCPYPLIAMVNGHALGGGLEMALSCDFIFAHEEALLGLPEVGLGLIPGFGGTQRPWTSIGKQKARRLIYTAKKIKATEAKEWGLVLETFSTHEELHQACLKELQIMQRNSPMAIRLAKESIRRGNEVSLEQGLKIEEELFSSLFGTDEMREGLQAFIEKRKANF